MKTLVSILALAILATGPLNAQAIVGSWFNKAVGKDNSYVVLTFLPNGTYLMVEDGNDKDDSGKDGMERGTYTWNSKTNAFSNKTISDTSGEWGLSDESVKKVTVSGKTLKVAGLEFKKVTSKKSKLVGSWYLKENGGYALVTFLANGDCFFAQDGEKDGGGKPGIERGTYKWNKSSKVFKSKVRVDTNGTWGLSSIGKAKISISGRRLSLKIAGEGTFKLRKVAK